MKKIYSLLLMLLVVAGAWAQETCITIPGDRTSGKFRQILLNSNGAYSSDTSQPEMGVAAWTCDALGYPACNLRTAFRFDVSEIPANAVVKSAKLYLYAKTNNINGNPGNPTFGGNNTSLVQRITSAWTMAGTGWANQPPTTTSGQIKMPQSSGTAQHYVVDMKDMVQFWVNNPGSNYGALMRLETENYYNSLIFHSGQSPEPVRPRLEICYTLETPPPPLCNEMVIRGNRIDGKFKTLQMTSYAPVFGDTSQSEFLAAAWTCNALGYPTCNVRTLFRYDVSSIPATAVVKSAKLYLYANTTSSTNGRPGEPTYGANNTALVQRVISPWSMGSTGWSNQPAVSTATQKVMPQSTNTAQNYVVDLTDFVQHWVSYPDSNYGALLRLQSEQYYNSMIFHSGQAPDSLKPRLEICYRVPKEDSAWVDIRLYPNPTTGPLLAWVNTNKAATGDIRLYDPRGHLKHVLRNVVHFQPGLNVIPMNIPRGKLRPGVYYVRVKVGSTVKTFKIVLL